MLIIIVIAINYQLNKTSKVQEESVLSINLSKKISIENGKGFIAKTVFGEKGIPLNEVIEAINEAKLDSKIKCIVLYSDSPECGWATLQEIRKALINFKNSKKKIYAYGYFIDEKGYYLTSTADRIFLNPNGGIKWQGLSTDVLFFNNALQKIGIEPIIYRVGKYKSGIEPFINNHISVSNKEQTTLLLKNIKSIVFRDIGISRSINEDSLNTYADSLLIRNANRALMHRFITNIDYEDAFELFVNNENGANAKNWIDITNYISSFSKKNKNKNKIAVVVLDGEIKLGKQTSGTIGSESVIELLNKLKNDESIKAVVLRINSLGGSSVASDLIWHSVDVLRAKKPVVASFSDYATSGGYYISAGCNKIVANETTITGSIGIYGYLLNKNEFYNKIGINNEVINTNKYSDFPSSTRKMSNFERSILQQNAQNGYDIFINRVAVGRKIKKETVEKNAQGRVWSGIEALKINLIDKIGGIDVAISEAVKLGHLVDDKVDIEYFTPSKRKNDYINIVKENIVTSVKNSLFSIEGKVFSESNLLYK